jgi:hypothetical protein
MDSRRLSGANRLCGRHQPTPRQLGNHLSGGFPFPPGSLLRGKKDVIGNIEGGAHASDDNTSRIKTDEYENDKKSTCYSV